MLIVDRVGFSGTPLMLMLIELSCVATLSVMHIPRTNTGQAGCCCTSPVRLLKWRKVTVNPTIPIKQNLPTFHGPYILLRTCVPAH